MYLLLINILNVVTKTLEIYFKDKSGYVGGVIELYIEMLI